MEESVKNITNLFKSWSGEDVNKIETIPESGSYRKYYRVSSQSKKCIAVYNYDKKENNAFIEYTKHFCKLKLPVPEILAEDQENCIYLQEDLEDTMLIELLANAKEGEQYPESLINLLKKVLDELLRFQIIGGKDLDYSNAYPRPEFDRQAIMWDLNYFKYHFLKLAKIPFDEQALESDFVNFTNFLLEADTNYFLYRDFQSRNIMIKNNSPYFIDYQGGRKGALAYDLASLLYDVAADIPYQIKDELKQYYILKLSEYNIDTVLFERHYFAYVLVRVMQAMGAFGFRGLYEKKQHFIQSIPFAVENLKYLLNNYILPIEVPELWKALNLIAQSDELPIKKENNDFEVDILSFSYLKGIPEDYSSNAGGFVFDCRGIHNPGRYEKYFNLTGRDNEVVDFFENDSEMDHFLKCIFPLVENAIQNPKRRTSNNLLVAFGCTGGQHRSVYAAEKLAQHLKEKNKISINLRHREQKF